MSVHLAAVEKCKCLGLIINNKFKYEKHVDEMVSKASKRLHILRVLSRFGASINDLKSIYISLVRSTLEYACVVWQDSLTEKQRSQIEKKFKKEFKNYVLFFY